MSNWPLFAAGTVIDFWSAFRFQTDPHLQLEPRSILDLHFDVELISSWSSNWDQFGSSFRCRTELSLKLEPRSIWGLHFDVKLTSIWSSYRDPTWIFILPSDWPSLEAPTKVISGSSIRCRTDLHLQLEPRSIVDLHQCRTDLNLMIEVRSMLDLYSDVELTSI